MNIFCIGKNYLEHIAEFDGKNPEEIVIFLKLPSSLIQTSPVPIPAFTQNLHYELEIVLHICQQGKDIPKQKADEFFDKLTLGIDFTARDIQHRLKDKSLPWEISKAFDNSAFLASQWIDKKTFADLKNIDFKLEKNKQVVQTDNTKMMIYDFPTIISEVSKYFTLQKGDLIYTGTPKGVGKCNHADVLEGFLQDKKIFSISLT